MVAPSEQQEQEQGEEEEEEERGQATWRTAPACE